MSSSLAPGLLLVGLLAGCVTADRPPPPPLNPFALPAGSPANVRIGFVQGFPVGSPTVPVAILPEMNLSEGMQVVARDAGLRPTALLEITSARGRIAVARIVRGLPRAREEVVLPSAALRTASQGLSP